VYCIAVANVCNRDGNETLACESVNNIDALHSKRCTCDFAVKQKLCILACKRDPMVRDRDETETFDFQSETRSRPRPSGISTRPRRLETTSRDRDYFPVLTAELVLLSSCDQMEYAERNVIEWFQDEAGKRACIEAGSLSGLKSAGPQVVSHGHPERPSCNLQVSYAQCTMYASLLMGVLRRNA